MLIKNISTATLALCFLACNFDPRGESGKPTPVRIQQRAVDAPTLTRAAPTRLDCESSGELRSAEVVAREGALRQSFGPTLGRAPGNQLAFIDCQEGPCLARFSAVSDEAMKQLLQGLSQDFPAVEIETRERLDPYQGRSFEADVTMAP